MGADRRMKHGPAATWSDHGEPARPVASAAQRESRKDNAGKAQYHPFLSFSFFRLSSAFFLAERSLFVNVLEPTLGQRKAEDLHCQAKQPCGVPVVDLLQD